MNGQPLFAAYRTAAGVAFGAALLIGGSAHAEPAAEATAAPVEAPVVEPTTAEAPAATAPAPAAATPAPAVSDDVWSAMQGRQVTVETPNGPIEGELASAEGDSVVLVAADGSVQAVPKATAQSVKVVQPPPAAIATPVPATPPTNTAAEPKPEESANPGEEETPAQKRRRERREKREHALLGAFTAHGATYTHWRGDGIDSGHASYAMDFGIGFNATKSFGMYAMAGGLLAAKIDHKQVKANYGHVNLMFAFGGKYYQSMFGAGGGFSRLNRNGDIQKDAGLSIPLRIFGKIPLPKKLYIGLGIAYEFAAVRNFGRYINAIGGQIILGRW